MPGPAIPTIPQNPRHRTANARPPSGPTSVTRVCDGLRYQSGVGNDDWRPLPEWAQFLIKLGALVGTGREAGQRSVAAVAVPTRAYAAVFLCVGTILARASSAFRPANVMQHLQMISSLPCGTPVMYWGSNRHYKGVFLGCEQEDGKLIARVQTEKGTSGGLKYVVPVDQWANIQILAKDSVALPAHQQGQQISTRQLLGALLGGPDARIFSMERCVDCILIGESKVLRDEIALTHIGFCAKDADVSSGTLQDILRVRLFLSPSEGCRSEVVPVSSKASKTLAHKEEPAVVVFDGSRAYIKWHSRWPNPHCMVVLDRTSPTFCEAVRELSQNCVERRTGDEWTEKGLPPVPAGLEVMVFEEELR